MQAKGAPRTPRTRNAVLVLLIMLSLIINDGVTGLLAAYLARSRLYDIWLHSETAAEGSPYAA